MSYYFFEIGAAGARMVSVSVFETGRGTAESNRGGAAWVSDHPNLIPSAKSAEAGPVVGS